MDDNTKILTELLESHAEMNRKSSELIEQQAEAITLLARPKNAVNYDVEILTDHGVIKKPATATEILNRKKGDNNA